jgi:cation diffusion facilitator CzcD-associated flavoprotein CzcO
MTSAEQVDCIVVGASFAGLACASSLDSEGKRVVVLEIKADPGGTLHTTGIIVKDALDEVALLDGKNRNPSGAFVRSYPRFRAKRLLRFAFDHFQSDVLFNLLLGTKPERLAAGMVYFHRRGVFDAVGNGALIHPSEAEDAGSRKLRRTGRQR